MFSLLDQNQSTDDTFFEITFKPSNEAPSKLAGLSIVEDGEPPYVEPPYVEPPYVEPRVPKKCNKKVKSTCVENYVVLGLATLLLITFAVSPPSKL